MFNPNLLNRNKQNDGMLQSLSPVMVPSGNNGLGFGSVIPGIGITGLGNSSLLEDKINLLKEIEQLNNLYLNNIAKQNEPYQDNPGIYEPSSIDGVDKATLEKIFQAEGGKKNGNYGMYGDIGDGAGLSIGAYQFTEKSGKAQKLAKMLGFKSIKDQGFKEALATPQGVKAQDELFFNDFLRLPKKYKEKYNIQDPKVYGFMIDTNLNGGLSSVINRAKKKGGLTLENLIQARKERYYDLIANNPNKFKKFEKGWMNRLKLWES